MDSSNEADLCESLDEVTWLWRGVPAESAEVADVLNCGEVSPPEPNRTGDRWRRLHVAGMTATAYTSWTTDRTLAVAAANACNSDDAELTGGVVIFRIRVGTLDPDRVFEGREDEDEYLIEGVVEGVEISEDTADEEDND